MLKLPYYLLPILISFMLLICTSLGYLGKYSWVFDLFSHFKFQFFLTAIACGLILIIFVIFSKKEQTTENKKNYCFNLAMKNKGFLLFALLSFIIALFNLMEIAPLYFPYKNEIKKSEQLRLMHINVNTSNRNFQQVEKYIMEQNPDILLLEEVNLIWINNLSNLMAEYPCQILYPQNDNFGIAMFAKIKPDRYQILHYGRYCLPYIKSEFSIQKKGLTIYGVHTLPPIGKGHWQERNQMLVAIANKVKKEDKKQVVILGDLNATPYCYAFKKLLRDANLRNSQCGFGIQATWPNQPFFLRIPIDHCLISEEIEVSKRFIGPDVGSDHFPLVIDIKIH